jgi:hypothetical protein
LEKDKDYTNIRNAWVVKYRYPKNKKGDREWADSCTFPAVDILEYDGDKMRPHDGSFDIGQGRAHVHAEWLRERYPNIEVRISRVGVQPWWLKPDGDPQREFELKAKYDSVIVGE